MKKTKFVELPEHVIEHLKSKFDKDYDTLAIEYLVLLEKLGKQTLLVTELPKGVYPSRVQKVLRPYLRECGYQFGYRNLTYEVAAWGFLRAY
ncbi:hypothetical protein DMW05_14425 [Vibrio parahaemolyticus]|nr:hypothetical protein [Vibrio parahaemolyticus]EGR2932431.1 hypothetical protein [Vibrio parahaemolyticus]EGR2956179.1 hypothetical protein [Vibrio parahaemolyticus]EGR2961277.1 hypothetical protein [Vibrio parahaemolyticus]EGR2967309.1 hypothetical protein [Vibrio parahaemolyticus]